jgi:hypothetical protein
MIRQANGDSLMVPQTLPDRRSAAIQLLLFESEGTSIVDLWDIAPRFLFNADEVRNDGQGTRRGGKSTRIALRGQKVVTRNFDYRGQTFKIELAAALIVVDGQSVAVFPGEREQVVEEVMRRIASKQGRLNLMAPDGVFLHFSVHELRRELEAVGHGYKYAEIREALEILHRCNIRITLPDGKGTALSSSVFPQMAIRTRTAEGETYVQLNALVSAAIRRLEFRQLSYEWLMRIKTPLARWIFKRLHHEIYQAGETPSDILVLAASDIARNSGMTQHRQLRDTYRRIGWAFDALADAGVLVKVDRNIVREGRRNADIFFRVVPSPRFLAEVRRSQRSGLETRQDFRAFVRQETDRFVPAGPAQVIEMRKRRLARRQPTEVPSLPYPRG